MKLKAIAAAVALGLGTGVALAQANQPVRIGLITDMSSLYADIDGPAGAEMIRTLKAKGYTVVLVEQNFRFAAPLADRFYIMEHGKIVKEFAQHQLKDNMAMLQEYLGV